MKRLVLSIAIGLCLTLGTYRPVQSAPEEYFAVRELNFVFLHGAGSNACSFQLLEDCLREKLPAYIRDYEQANPGIKIRVNTLKRCYPAYEDIESWANNIAESINQHFPDKKRLILIGHSMGGKVALYAVAHNTGGLADKVAMITTINSPIKRLDNYYVAGGGPVYNYCRTAWLQSDEGICSSVAYYDSSQDGNWVSSQKHWLAFISGEAAPLSKQYDAGGVDGWPRDMDDGVIPISAQYADGADVIYYGEHQHSDFAQLDEVALPMAEQILDYIFGGSIECSVLARGGIFRHEAGWLPGTDYWQDSVGEIPVQSGSLWHVNESYTRWQEWEDVVGELLPGKSRSSYQTVPVSFVPFVAQIKESRWLNSENPEDCQLYIRTRAAPRSQIRVNWIIYEEGLLAPELYRDHYEVEISTGTPFTSINQALWTTDEPRDLRLRIWSEALRPFRWFKAQWRVYYKESRQRKVIDAIPLEPLLKTSSDNLSTSSGEDDCCP